MDKGFNVVENFHDEAEALRAGFEAHFADPAHHKPDRHQVWNYWYVPGAYAYLRTDPSKIVGKEMAQRFYDHVVEYAFERWGFGQVYWPYMSCYVAGCHQILHNDAKGGRLGYVYSLTRWDERKFTGGETLIFKQEGFHDAMHIAAASTSFYDLIPSRFNQLLVFDDRLPHAVPRLEGGMDPVSGRVVMHGHFAEGPPVLEGALVEEGRMSQIEPRLSKLMLDVTRLGRNAFHGLLILRADIDAQGVAQDARVTFDRVLPLKQGSTEAFDVEAAVALLKGMKFPEAQGVSRVTVPIPIAPL